MGPQSPEGSNPGSAFELGDLLARVANLDRAAFARLYALTHARLYGVVSRIVRGPDASCDVLQDIYVRIWERAGDYDPTRGSPLAWMATIARNRALDEVRRVRPISLEEISGNFEPAAEEVDPLRARQASEDSRALLRCLETLDEEKRRMVLLAYYHGESRETLSRRFGRPIATVKTWLRRSLAQLKDCLGS